MLKVQTSKNISFDNLHYANGAALLRATGDHSPGIRLTNANAKLAKKDVELGQRLRKKTVVVATR